MFSRARGVQEALGESAAPRGAAVSHDGLSWEVNEPGGYRLHTVPWRPARQRLGCAFVGCPLPT